MSCRDAVDAVPKTIGRLRNNVTLADGLPNEPASEHPFAPPSSIATFSTVHLLYTQSSSAAMGVKPRRMVFSVTTRGSRNWIR